MLAVQVAEQFDVGKGLPTEPRERAGPRDQVLG